MQDSELECVLKLNKQVQGVKDRHKINKVQNEHLEKQFDALEARFQNILKVSGKSQAV